MRMAEVIIILIMGARSRAKEKKLQVCREFNWYCNKSNVRQGAFELVKNARENA